MINLLKVTKIYLKATIILNQKFLDVLLNSLDVAFQLTSILNGNRNRNHWSADTGGSAKGLLGSHKNVRNVFILTQKWQMKQNLQWFGIGGHNNKLGNTSIQAFSSLISALSKLFVVSGLLDQIKNLLGQTGIGEWVGFWVNAGLVAHNIFFSKCQGWNYKNNLFSGGAHNDGSLPVLFFCKFDL